MNISRAEQRTLHALAQGGRIVLEKDEAGRVLRADCLTREGWLLGDCSPGVWKKLKRRRLVRSCGGGPYHITREGLEALRPQLDNRVSQRRW
ncbi:MAG TPA: YjhX family toxin [Caulobacteraceae bacterium]|nr:YjhX family toxin [Caulobacteraceae bacterium]